MCTSVVHRNTALLHAPPSFPSDLIFCTRVRLTCDEQLKKKRRQSELMPIFNPQAKICSSSGTLHTAVRGPTTMTPLKFDTEVHLTNPYPSPKKSREIEAHVALWRPRPHSSTHGAPLTASSAPLGVMIMNTPRLCSRPPLSTQPYFSEQKRNRCLRGTRRDATERIIGS